VELCALRGNRFIDTATTALKHLSPLFAYLYRRASRLERAARAQGVDTIWFVGGTVFDTPGIPYIATVWDVQHRTHPWFPEVSHRSQWDYREALHARFLKRATYAITGTRTGADQLGWYYQVPPERIRILPHPTPLQVATVPTGNGSLIATLKQKTFVFYPAQFWPHKNHANLLLALKILVDRDGLDLDLVLSARGWSRDSACHPGSIFRDLSTRRRWFGCTRTHWPWSTHHFPVRKICRRSRLFRWAARSRSRITPGRASSSGTRRFSSIPETQHKWRRPSEAFSNSRI
jgi:hypothetical protein